MLSALLTTAPILEHQRSTNSIRALDFFPLKGMAAFLTTDVLAFFDYLLHYIPDLQLNIKWIPKDFIFIFLPE